MGIPISMPRQDKTRSKLNPSVQIQVPDPGVCCVASCQFSYNPPRWGTGNNSNWIVCEQEALTIKHGGRGMKTKQMPRPDGLTWKISLICYATHHGNTLSMLHQSPSGSIMLLICPRPSNTQLYIYIYTYTYTYITYGHIYRATVWTCLDPHRYDWLGEILSQLLSLRTLG